MRLKGTKEDPSGMPGMVCSSGGFRQHDSKKPIVGQDALDLILLEMASLISSFNLARDGISSCSRWQGAF